MSRLIYYVYWAYVHRRYRTHGTAGANRYCIRSREATTARSITYARAVIVMYDQSRVQP